MSIRAISNSTPVSIGLIILLLAGATWTGHLAGNVQTTRERMQEIGQRSQRIEDIVASLNVILSKLTVMIEANGRRIDALERSSRRETKDVK